MADSIYTDAYLSSTLPSITASTSKKSACKDSQSFSFSVFNVPPESSKPKHISTKLEERYDWEKESVQHNQSLKETDELSSVQKGTSQLKYIHHMHV